LPPVTHGHTSDLCDACDDALEREDAVWTPAPPPAPQRPRPPFRALVRLWNVLQEQLHDCWEADRRYDAGEWSDDFHAASADHALDDMLARHGWEREEWDAAVNSAGHREYDALRGVAQGVRS
jgi:hypothetical protein